MSDEKKIKYYEFLLENNLRQQEILKSDEIELRKKIKEEKGRL